VSPAHGLRFYFSTVAGWPDRVDPGTHRRIKGLRLVTAYGVAWMLGALPGLAPNLPGRATIPALAAGLALWASVSEGRAAARAQSARDLVLLVLAGMVGATLMVLLAPRLTGRDLPGAELILVTGAFAVGYLRRYGILGAGIGSQIFIGELLVFNARLTVAEIPMVGIAGLVAIVAAVVPRMLSGPAEHPATATAEAPLPGHTPGDIALRMGLQGAVAALAIVLLNDAVGLEESAWAITACTYVIAGSRAATVTRIWRRFLGTAVGVPLGLAALPLAEHLPLLVWAAAALAMVIYAMALPERYDIACGAYAFALIVTLVASGQASLALLLSRGWETVIGGVLGLLCALALMPPSRQRSSRQRST
jgi:hypothetical protein